MIPCWLMKHKGKIVIVPAQEVFSPIKREGKTKQNKRKIPKENIHLLSTFFPTLDTVLEGEKAWSYSNHLATMR